MFTDEQINAVGKPGFNSSLTDQGRAVVRRILDAAIAQGLVRPVTVGDEEIQMLANVLHEHAEKTGTGHSPSWWTASWREWYRERARMCLEPLGLHGGQP